MNILNTKNDYLNLLETDKEQAKIELQKLLDNRFHWFDADVLDADVLDAGVQVDETHRIIGEADERILQEYKEDMNSMLFMLGFSIEEVEGIINEG